MKKSGVQEFPFGLDLPRQLRGVQAYTDAMAESLPRSLRPPVALALARAVETIPSAGALPGDLVFEPKWDGFRECALIGADEVSLFSRQGRDLSRYFPELISALGHQVPPGVCSMVRRSSGPGAGWISRRCSAA
ncbi:atp-Dependent DNA ligase [Arthrobacter sp. Hiyo1]|nr:atp-Dependent DNA ligase [Arthrobacter sp. Hiyo1]